MPSPAIPFSDILGQLQVLTAKPVDHRRFAAAGRAGQRYGLPAADIRQQLMTPVTEQSADGMNRYTRRGPLHLCNFLSCI
ncbi:hypothetical protein D3C74_422000 [compost metagenome]